MYCIIKNSTKKAINKKNHINNLNGKYLRYIFCGYRLFKGNFRYIPDFEHFLNIVNLIQLRSEDMFKKKEMSFLKVVKFF